MDIPNQQEALADADRVQEQNNNNNIDIDDDDDSDMSSFDNDDDDDVSSSSSMGSEIEEEAQRLMDALQAGTPAAPSATPASPAKPPEQILQEYLNGIQASKTTALKLDDSIVEYLSKMEPSISKVQSVNKLYRDLTIAIRSSNEMKHVILGTNLLQLLDPMQQQLPLYQLLISKHASTITYWKLGSNDATELCGIPTEALLTQMVETEWPTLTEFQVRGMELQTLQQVALCVQLLQQSASTIKLFNLLGLVLSPELLSTAGLFDALWTTVEPITQCDELQLHCIPTSNDSDGGSGGSGSNDTNTTSMPALISHGTLEHLLAVKPKWWRMALDGMGLDDGHLQIIGHALKNIEGCKMNDLLSIRNNPKVTPKGLSQLYNVCLNKQRMGLVHSDDPTWGVIFDLVRPLNNLHRRLEYKNDQGQFVDPEKWMEWFQVLSNLPWMDETRKLNYIWFTLVEQPEMINTTIEYCRHRHYQCGSSSSNNNNYINDTTATTTSPMTPSRKRKEKV